MSVAQVEVENFVLKMAAEFPSRRDQLIFLINNYDMMLSVLMVNLHICLCPYFLVICCHVEVFAASCPLTCEKSNYSTCVLIVVPCVSRRGQQTTVKRWKVSNSCCWPGRR